MPKRTDIKKILVIGSGPIVIGQAAEFDYAGTQACLALKEEGYEVILVNSNPATIMTDKEIADKVYIEPITVEFVTRILRKERPDAILPTLGGQTGLNMAMSLSKTGILDDLNIELLGTKLSAIDQAEDRDLFKKFNNKYASENDLQELSSAITYIKNHYSEQITLDDLCKASFISKQMLIRYFNKFLGKSPLVYITEYKMNLIKSLLLSSSEVSIKEICTLFGFEDQCYFSRIFKKYTGKTPRNYRKTFYDATQRTKRQPHKAKP